MEPDVEIIEIPSGDLARALAAMAMSKLLRRLAEQAELLVSLRNGACLKNIGHDPMELNKALKSVIDTMVHINDSIIFSEKEASDPEGLIQIGNAKDAIAELYESFNLEGFDPEVIRQENREREAKREAEREQAAQKEHVRELHDQYFEQPSWKWANALHEGEMILDAAGWDREHFIASWEEPITREEFERRWNASTTGPKPSHG